MDTQNNMDNQQTSPKLEEPKKPTKTKYFLDKNTWLVKGAIILSVVSIFFRLIAYWGFWKDLSSDSTYTNVLLPVVCSVLFAIFVPLFGKKAIWMTSIPVFLLSVFLIMEAATLKPWIVIMGSILLYVVAACVYTMTVFGKIRTKWVLVVTIGTPLVYHLAVQDRTTLINASTPATLIQWMPELSAISFLLALLFVALAMEKERPSMYVENQDVPQIIGLKHVPSEMAYNPLPKKTKEDKKLLEEKENELLNASNEIKEENPEILPAFNEESNLYTDDAKQYKFDPETGEPIDRNNEVNDGSDGQLQSGEGGIQNP